MGQSRWAGSKGWFRTTPRKEGQFKTMYVTFPEFPSTVLTNHHEVPVVQPPLSELSKA